MSIDQSRPCPECGGDPRGGRIAPPRWARWTGAPLTLGLLGLSLLILGGLSQERMTRTGIARSACEPWVKPRLLVAEIRAGAASDEHAAARVAREVLDQARLDAMAMRTSSLAVAPFHGPGWRSEQVRLGWPLRWLSWGTTSQYDEVLSRTANEEITAGAPWRWRWLRSDPAISVSASNWGLNVHLGALASLVLILLVLAAALHAPWNGDGGCRPPRRRRTRRVVLIALAAIVVLLPQWRERSEVQWPRRGMSSPTLAEVDAMSRTGAGAVALAAILEAQLEGALDEHRAQVFWRLPVATSDISTLGWPIKWIGHGSRTPVDPIRSEPSPAQVRLAVLQDCLMWISVDRSGAERLVWLSPTALSAGVLPLVLMCLSPRLLWMLVARRQERRWRAAGRCLACGYGG